MVLQAIWETRPTVAVIDGMLDIIRDYNDIEECQEIITKCMQVSSYYNCSVWCLVHQNPGRNDKMAGSLGSILERKVTDILATLKEVSPEGITLSYTERKLIEGKKRKVEVEVEDFHAFSEIKWVKEYLDFK